MSNNNRSPRTPKNTWKNGVLSPTHFAYAPMKPIRTKNFNSDDEEDCDCGSLPGRVLFGKPEKCIQK